MPPLPSHFRRIVNEESLPFDSARAELFEPLSRTQLRTIAKRAVDLLGEGMGSVLVDLGVRRSDVPELTTAAALRASGSYGEILAGDREISWNDGDKTTVVECQRALQAVAARIAGAPTQMRLPTYGADGDYGGETAAAVKALQDWAGLTATLGGFGQAEAEAVVEKLNTEPVPDLWSPIDDETIGDAASADLIVSIARGIVRATDADPFRRRVDGRDYVYTSAEFGVPPARSGLLRAPGGIAYGLSNPEGYWKCNVFGGTVLGLAQLPVPTHSVGRHRHYPRAERFGPKLKRKRGWNYVAPPLDHRDPNDPNQPIRSDANQQEIAALLDLARPGDMFFVDHPGEPGNNGGHTRVCVEAASAGDSDHAPLWAQAQYDGAIERRDGMAKVGGGAEIRFWLLRYSG